MEKFESKISNVLILHLLRSIFVAGMLYGISKVFFEGSINMNYFSFIVVAILFLIATYVFIGITNNDIYVFEDRLEIKNRIPLFRKTAVFKLNNISSVVFRDDWTEKLYSIKPTNKLFEIVHFLISQLVIQMLFPSDYKWISITSDKQYRFYCFGLEYDYYDNPKPYFEDLFEVLKSKGIDIKWANVAK